MILVSRPPAMIWDVRRSADRAVIGNLARKRTYVNHYSFHIIDSQWAPDDQDAGMRRSARRSC